VATETQCTGRGRHGKSRDGTAELDVYSDRYRRLRALEPGRFTCSDAEYWEGFYS
jgi:hypothetical protein